MIDWAVYARLDRLFVKLFEQERDLDVHFLVDCSDSMRWSPAPGENGTAPKLDAARRIAAALSYIALANLDRVNVGWFDANLGEDLGLTRGKGQFHKVLDFLRTAPGASGATALERSFRTFTQRLKRRGLVFVLSDFLDPAGTDAALSLLRYHQFEVHVIQVLHPAELNPELSGDLRLTECETGAVYELTASDALVRAYREQVNSFLAGLEQFCLQRGVGYALAPTGVPFEDLVLRVLRDGVMLQ